jgi:DNA polymerase eta
VTAETGFSCSAGVSVNKTLAKLTGGMHKPNAQTILVPEGVPPLLSTLAIDRIRGLGGDKGKEVSDPTVLASTRLSRWRISR